MFFLQVLSVVPSMAFSNLLKLSLPLEIGQVSEESRWEESRNGEQFAL